jgi:uncharacterized protein (UPF0218 family)
VNPLDLAAKLKKNSRSANQNAFEPNKAEDEKMVIEVFTVGDVVSNDELYTELKVNVKRYPHRHKHGNSELVNVCCF